MAGTPGHGPNLTAATTVTTAKTGLTMMNLTHTSLWAGLLTLALNAGAQEATIRKNLA